MGTRDPSVCLDAIEALYQAAELPSSREEIIIEKKSQAKLRRASLKMAAASALAKAGMFPTLEVFAPEGNNKGGSMPQRTEAILQVRSLSFSLCLPSTNTTSAGVSPKPHRCDCNV